MIKASLAGRIFIALILLLVVGGSGLLARLYKDPFYLILGLIVALGSALALYEHERMEKRVSVSDLPKKIITGVLKFVSSLFYYPLIPLRLYRRYKVSIRKRVIKVVLVSGLVNLVVATLVHAYLISFQLPSASGEIQNIISLSNLLVISLVTYLKSSLIVGSLYLGVVAFLLVGIILFLRKPLGSLGDKKGVILIASGLVITITTSLASLPLALFGSLVFAGYEVKQLEREFNTGLLADLQIVTAPKEIQESLAYYKSMPTIIGNDKDTVLTITTSLLEKRQRSQFYQRKLIPLATKWGRISLQVKDDVLYLPNHTLVVFRINKDVFQTISARLGRQLAEKELDPHYIKPEPFLTLLSKQDYIVYRDQQIDEQIEEVDSYIAQAQREISALKGYITEDQNNIEANKANAEESVAKRDSDYNYCKSAGYYSYYYGYFFRYYSDDDCNRRRAEWDALTESFTQNIQYWEAELQADQRRLTAQQESLGILQRYRQLVESQRDTVLYELGLFEPPDTVKVVLETADSQALADFFVTVVHEYLHYTSYISDERELSRFFEEGLTEYFARKAIASQLKTSTNVGYPLIVKVMEQIVPSVGEEVFEEIYFNKDEKQLIAVLNEKYGEKFYEDTEYYFSIIPLLSMEDGLKLANNIIFAIGGKELKEEDLFK